MRLVRLESERERHTHPEREKAAAKVRVFARISVCVSEKERVGERGLENKKCK